MIFRNIKKYFILLLMAIVMLLPENAFAEGDGGASITMSPMNQVIILNPGDSYDSSFKIVNPYTGDTDIHYKIVVVPFYVNDGYHISFEERNNYNQMTDWITVSKEEGVLSPNEDETIYFTINVPDNAPSGGQYAAIRAEVVNNGSDKVDGINLEVSYGLAHIIYAEITGETVRQGEILDINVPGFVIDGNINGSVAVKNTGNVHSGAKYTLQVFPLFSSEEAYTNEEDPATNIVLPDRTLYTETVWDKTPLFGIFNVVYTVEFAGITQQVSKMVIKCPIWLLFIVILAVLLVIFYLISRSKSRKKKQEEPIQG